jgi:hypothetical protein
MYPPDRGRQGGPHDSDGRQEGHQAAAATTARTNGPDEASVPAVTAWAVLVANSRKEMRNPVDPGGCRAERDSAPGGRQEALAIGRSERVWRVKGFAGVPAAAPGR